MMSSFASFFLIIIIIVESIWPFRRINWLVRERVEDTYWLIIYNYLYPLVRTLLIVTTINSIQKIYVGHRAINVQLNNKILQLSALFFCADFCSYFIHRVLHKYNFLWNFHKLHHTSTTLVSISAYRQSFFDGLIFSLPIVVISILFQFDQIVIFYYAIISETICVYQHSNIKYAASGWPSKIIFTNHHHRIHHWKEHVYPSGQNFGFFFSFWDRLFGTYSYTLEDKPTGLNDVSYPSHPILRLIYPLKARDQK